LTLGLAASVRKFNESAENRKHRVLCVSRDLPFAQKRFLVLKDLKT
jgi:peroxiredoxin